MLANRRIKLGKTQILALMLSADPLVGSDREIPEMRFGDYHGGNIGTVCLRMRRSDAVPSLRLGLCVVKID